MSESLNRDLRGHSLRFHLFVALAMGLFVRTLSAIFAHGPQAMDEYRHGILPAYQVYAHQLVDLPDFHSHLLVRLLLGFLKVGHLFGVESPLWQVPVAYLGLGLLSGLAILGAFIYGSCFRSRAFCALALYLLAMHSLMPFVSPHVFGESVALAFVVPGLALCKHARIKTRSSTEIFVGFFVLGLAVLFRFQVGIISCAYGLILLVQREWRFSLAILLAGLALLLAESKVGVMSGNFPFDTLKAYLQVNSDGAVQYAIFPWYNSWLFILAIALFPFAVVFAHQFKHIAAPHGPLMICLFVFVLIYSGVPNKDDSFMYLIVGLSPIGLTYVWTLSRHDRWAKRIYWAISLFVTEMTLPIACFVNRQARQIEPDVVAEHDLDPAVYIFDRSFSVMSIIRFSFL